ncbi:hypothetical protein ISS85_04920 [Candidatus Microgenomates bacterium]|nr:hypothetical protein [Candidatus Microgenomates bacterium]
MSNRDLLFLSILTFVTVIAWIAFDVYHTAMTSTITPLQKELIKPLTPIFDQEIIIKLRERKSI